MLEKYDELNNAILGPFFAEFCMFGRFRDILEQFTIFIPF